MNKLNLEVHDGLAAVPVGRSQVNGLSTTPHTVRRVGIVGANTTGIGIAMSLLDADVPVTIFDLERASIGKGIAMARAGYQDAVRHGRLDAGGGERRMALLAGCVNFHHLKDCDLVIEAVPTDSGSKASLFRRLDDTVKPGAILMTCTSPTRIDQLAASTRRAGEVLGLHLSCPPGVGETWTLVPGKGSSGETLATVVALAQHLGKACVVSGSPGGDASHESSTWGVEGDAVPWQVDQIME